MVRIFLIAKKLYIDVLTIYKANSGIAEFSFLERSDRPLIDQVLDPTACIVAIAITELLRPALVDLQTEAIWEIDIEWRKQRDRSTPVLLSIEIGERYRQ